MKRAIIGGFLSLIGSILVHAIVISADSYLLDGWSTPPGKLLTQITEADLMPWFVGSIILVLLGIVLMAVEFFKKDK